MPESNGPSRRGEQWTLSKAHQAGQYVRIWCSLCKITRRYRCDEIAALCGDIVIYDVGHKFRCEQCKKTEYMSADYFSLYGPDIGKTTIRRLVRVKVVRKPIWRDEVI